MTMPPFCRYSRAASHHDPAICTRNLRDVRDFALKTPAWPREGHVAAGIASNLSLLQRDCLCMYLLKVQKATNVSRFAKATGVLQLA